MHERASDTEGAEQTVPADESSRWFRSQLDEAARKDGDRAVAGSDVWADDPQYAPSPPRVSPVARVADAHSATVNRVADALARTGLGRRVPVARWRQLIDVAVMLAILGGGIWLISSIEPPQSQQLADGGLVISDENDGEEATAGSDASTEPSQENEPASALEPAEASPELEQTTEDDGALSPLALGVRAGGAPSDGLEGAVGGLTERSAGRAGIGSTAGPGSTSRSPSGTLAERIAQASSRSSAGSLAIGPIRPTDDAAGGSAAGGSGGSSSGATRPGSASGSSGSSSGSSGSSSGSSGSASGSSGSSSGSSGSSSGSSGSSSGSSGSSSGGSGSSSGGSAGSGGSTGSGSSGSGSSGSGSSGSGSSGSGSSDSGGGGSTPAPQPDPDPPTEPPATTEPGPGDTTEEAAAPSIASLSVNRGEVCGGDDGSRYAFQLTWRTSGATSVTLSTGSGAVAVADSGSTDVCASSGSAATLIASNSSGSTTKTVPLS
jgi:hypothetical protein